jgi:RNA recognition motif-containing protein
MPVRLFVGNLPYDATEAELREHFGQVGPLSHVFIPVDRETGRPRGFAFVEFMDRAPAEEAVARLNSQPFKGRPLSVSEARAREDRPGGPRPPGAGPRPGGPPAGRADWTPRPPGPRTGPPGTGSFGPPAEGRPGRNFGPDAPRRGKAKPMRSKREERVGGPIPIRGGGRIYDVDDLEDSSAVDEFDDVASALPDEKDEE